jgi:peptide/nickel transport system permease protein
MLNFILRRLFQTGLVIAALSFGCYYLLTLMPGDPVELMIQSNPKITPEDIARLRALHGLDQPVLTRYYNWISTVFSGDLGYSRTYRVPVSEIMGSYLFNTFILSVCALVLSLSVAIPLGVFAALNAGKKQDYIIGFFAFGGISTPSFWLGIVLILIFAVQLKWLPAGGTQPIGEVVSGVSYWVERGKYLILPVLTLSYLQIGSFLRYTRASMLEAMRNDYIRTARAKGLLRKQVVWKHGFRNALLSIITMVALALSQVFSGAVITETIFSYQGVGKLLFDSIQSNDYNVAMVSLMISVSMVLIFNLIADVAYSFADPRIKLS